MRPAASARRATRTPRERACGPQPAGLPGKSGTDAARLLRSAQTSSNAAQAIGPATWPAPLAMPIAGLCGAPTEGPVCVGSQRDLLESRLLFAPFPACCLLGCARLLPPLLPASGLLTSGLLASGLLAGLLASGLLACGLLPSFPSGGLLASGLLGASFLGHEFDLLCLKHGGVGAIGLLNSGRDDRLQEICTLIGRKMEASPNK